MEISNDLIVPRPIPVRRHCSLQLLCPRWYYTYTKFKIDELQRLHHLLHLPAVMQIGSRNQVSSEEALIITCVKVFTGFTFVHLADTLGEPTDSHLSLIYRHTMEAIDTRSDETSHGNSMEREAPHFQRYADAIRAKLESPEFGAVLLGLFRICCFLDATMFEK